jgi:hypothetical protein
VILTAALRVPTAFGVNVTLIVQLAPDITTLPQVLVCAKSPAFVPLTRINEIESVPSPVFFNVTSMGKLVVPTFVTGNCSVVGDKFTTG